MAGQSGKWTRTPTTEGCTAIPGGAGSAARSASPPLLIETCKKRNVKWTTGARGVWPGTSIRISFAAWLESRIGSTESCVVFIYTKR